MIVGWLWRYAPHAILAAGLGLLCIYAVHTFREQGRAELRPEIERLEAALAAEKADRARAERASDAYQSEMESLRRAAAGRAANRPPVRLCVTPESQAGTTAQGVNDSAPATRSDDGAPRSDPQAGPDIGADLYALVAACDAENAKLRALQGWILDGG